MIERKFDVIVIGAGLSGLMAAAKAVVQGNRVMVVAKGMGTMGLSSGCIDFWGFQLEQPRKVCSNPLQELEKVISTKPGHPFARVRDVISESIEFFREICEEEGNPYASNSGGNWLLPTAMGTLRPTFLAPTSMAVPSLSEPDKILVADFKELKDFYPKMMISNLRGNGEVKVSSKFTAVTLSVSEGELTTNALAHLLEQQHIRNRVVEQLKPRVSQESIVLFPPVLGERRNTKVARDLAAGMGCRVYEVANIPPALPGQRLQKTLLHHLRAQGVEIAMNAEVTGAHVFRNRCKNITVVGAGQARRFSAEVYVLATGSFLGGGLEANPGRIGEKIFQLPVQGTLEKWSSKEFLDREGHPFSRFGIAVNDSLQPVDKDKRVLIENLLVTGANIAGCNYPIEKCGNGVALVTGYKAGKLVKEVGQ